MVTLVATGVKVARSGSLLFPACFQNCVVIYNCALMSQVYSAADSMLSRSVMNLDVGRVRAFGTVLTP